MLPRRSRGRLHLRSLVAGAAVVLAASVAVATPAAAQAPAPAPPHTIDGPSAAISGSLHLSVARDGSGGLVYVKGGHVFVSRLAGSFQPPEQIDTGLGAESSQPVIAASSGGLLVIAFVNGGGLYVVQRPSATAGYTGPTQLAPGGSNPALSISPLGKAYLAFDVGGGVQCGYYYNGSWAVSPSLGGATGPPAVAAAGDGIGVVAWPNAGHVYTRRMNGNSPSVEVDQVDVPTLNGVSEAGADQPAVATGGDSSYIAVAFREFLGSGPTGQSRVLMRQQVASTYGPPAAADGLSTPDVDSALAPNLAVDEYGEGLVVSERATSHTVVAMRLGTHSSPGAVSQMNSLPIASPPDPVAGSAGYHSAAVAWQQDPGGSGIPEIRLRYYDAGTFGPEQVVSTPSAGPTDAADGLAVAGDTAADVAVAWVQGSPGARSIVVAQLYQPPGGFGPLSATKDIGRKSSTLSWSPARGTWGPITYTVSIDGAPVAKTTGTSIPLPAGIGQGRHVWQVTAANPAGQTSTSRTAKIFVDTVNPKARPKLHGNRVAGSPLRLDVHVRDPKPSSGIKAVRVKWGDGSTASGSTASHVYHAPGRYRITVIVIDRAGNQTKATVAVRIAGGKPGKRRHGHH